MLLRDPLLLSRELLLFDRRESERIDDLVEESADARIAVRLDNIIDVLIDLLIYCDELSCLIIVLF